MDKSVLDLYLYMGNHQAIIEGFEKDGISTEEAAKMALYGSVQSNMVGFMSMKGTSLAGTSNASKKVLEHFRNKEKNNG